MADELVTYAQRGPAAIVTLNRADKRNALSRALIGAIEEAFTRAADDSDARCVILTGAGDVFCAGMDLAELKRAFEQGSDESTSWEEAIRLARLLDQIYRLPKPTIAAVNGAAVAGGAGLVSVCDLVVCSPECMLGYPEVRRGLVAAMVMPHLLRHVGERAARHLLLTGDLISGEEALEIGFVNKVVPASEVMDQAMRWASSIAEGGPCALISTKDLLSRFTQHAASIEESAKASAAPRLTEECQEGLRAFFEKRPAPWVPSFDSR